MASSVSGAPEPTEAPLLSVVVLVWDNQAYTEAFVESVRAHTDVPYELIVVDNGSQPATVEYVRHAADHAILNPENRGFAAGMNQGLAAARGTYVAFCNNDTVVPARWASRLVETSSRHPRAGIVVPAITTAPNPVTVRTEPGTSVEVLDPFSAPPAAVVYLMRRALAQALGGWEEEYAVASGEDVDLGFKVWVNDLDIVFDSRVLVEHVGHATASRLDDSGVLWSNNRRIFLDKWSGDRNPPRVDGCDPERFARNRATARATASWMDKYFTLRDRRRERLRDAADKSDLTRSRRRLLRVRDRAVRRLRRLTATHS